MCVCFFYHSLSAPFILSHAREGWELRWRLIVKEEKIRAGVWLTLRCLIHYSGMWRGQRMSVKMEMCAACVNSESLVFPGGRHGAEAQPGKKNDVHGRWWRTIPAFKSRRLITSKSFPSVIRLLQGKTFLNANCLIGLTEAINSFSTWLNSQDYSSLLQFDPLFGVS